ncbi:NUDIX domain-containing protein [Candidatus Uhrbacteria bacterium]|mgnify:CR=1 FL=1|jgi:cob(I)alamin adenosyltransferase|nr:NUDIX domain-containing protein [Candidatus Uhrbacteria bacterium]MBT7717676.1 NUDIX domain-containing protein [Candidatus Uhrbacteria bacterium]
MHKLYNSHKALLVDRLGKVLLLRSSNPNEYGEDWDLPGGMMESGEEPLDCLVREVLEETGIHIDKRDAKMFYQKMAKGFGDMASEDVLKTFYTVSIEDHELALSWEHKDFRWIDPRNNLDDDIDGYVVDVIEAYREFALLPQPDDRIIGHKGYGLVQLIHGEGKGKTTSAIGQSVRAAGAGKKVKIVFFDKGGNTHYSERKMFDQIKLIDYFATGRDRIDSITGAFDFDINDEDKSEAQRGLKDAREALTSGDYDFVVLDEINSTVALGMLSSKEVIDAIEARKPGVEVLMTGRHPEPDLLSIAHLVTEAKMHKHYFYSGVQAREGLDY